MCGAYFKQRCEDGKPRVSCHDAQGLIAVWLDERPAEPELTVAAVQRHHERVLTWRRAHRRDVHRVAEMLHGTRPLDTARVAQVEVERKIVPDHDLLLQQDLRRRAHARPAALGANAELPRVAVNRLHLQHRNLLADGQLAEGLRVLLERRLDRRRLHAAARVAGGHPAAHPGDLGGDDEEVVNELLSLPVRVRRSRLLGALRIHLFCDPRAPLRPGLPRRALHPHLRLRLGLCRRCIGRLRRGRSRSRGRSQSRMALAVCRLFLDLFLDVFSRGRCWLRFRLNVGQLQLHLLRIHTVLLGGGNHFRLWFRLHSASRYEAREARKPISSEASLARPRATLFASRPDLYIDLILDPLWPTVARPGRGRRPAGAHHHRLLCRPAFGLSRRRAPRFRAHDCPPDLFVRRPVTVGHQPLVQAGTPPPLFFPATALSVLSWRAAPSRSRPAAASRRASPPSRTSPGREASQPGSRSPAPAPAAP